MIKPNGRTGMMAALLATAVLILSVPAHASEQETTVQQATAVLDKIMEIPESAIPPSLLSNAYGRAS